MNLSEAMDLLKSGKKVTRKDWNNGIHFSITDGKIKSYMKVVERYQYNEDIMISDGWIVEDETESKNFCDIIQHLQKGRKAWLKDWKPGVYIYLETQVGLVLQKWTQFTLNPTFADFKADDWVEL